MIDLRIKQVSINGILVCIFALVDMKVSYNGDD